MQLATATDSISDLDAQVQQLQSEVLDMQEQVQGAEAQLKYATTQLREQAATKNSKKMPRRRTSLHWTISKQQRRRKMS